MNLKYRIALILACVVASAWSLFPRTVVERVKRADGFVFDTVRRVPLKKGLDLQGGMHLVLEINESKGAIANKGEAIDRALKVVRTRIDQFGVAEPLVQKAGLDRINVDLPGIDDQQRALDVVEKQAFLKFQITDKSSALDRALPRLDGIVREKKLAVATPGAPQSGAAPATQAGLEKLFTPTDTGKKTGKDSTQKGDSAKKDSASIPGLTDREGPFSKLLRQGEMPGEYMVASTDMQTVQRFLDSPDIQAALPPGKEIHWGSDSLSVGATWFRPLYVVDARPIITGDYLQDAQPNRDPVEGVIVTFELSNEGGRRFRTETGRHVKDYMAIVLDDRVMGRPPVIQSAIGTRGQITMGQGRDLQTAQDLALVLRAGALPVPLRVADVRVIGASLGQDSITKGIRSLGIAMLLVVVIMIVYYRVSGMLAVAALGLYVLYTLAILAGFNAVLTLPGLAGFVLSVGMALDANVLIFERIREELDRGKTVRTAIDEGFRHAMNAIIDTSVTTLLTAAVLYQYGTGPVRGFAVTLIAGICASLFTSIFVVRTFYLIWLTRSRGAEALSI